MVSIFLFDRAYPYLFCLMAQVGIVRPLGTVVLCIYLRFMGQCSCFVHSRDVVWGAVQIVSSFPIGPRLGGVLWPLVSNFVGTPQVPI